MNQKEWTAKLVSAVTMAALGDKSKLADLAQSLADTEVATESLISAGFGDTDDRLIDIVAEVLERKAELQ